MIDRNVTGLRQSPDPSAVTAIAGEIIRDRPATPLTWPPQVTTRRDPRSRPCHLVRRTSRHLSPLP